MQSFGRKATVGQKLKLHDNEIRLQPWFLPKPVAAQISKILLSAHLAKMRYYFDDYGCIRCEKRDVMYGRNGFCENCTNITWIRIDSSLKRRLRNVGDGRPEQYADLLGDCVKRA